MFDSKSFADLRRGAEQLAAARESVGLATGVQACEALRQVQKAQDVLDGVHATLLARVEESEGYSEESASSCVAWARRELRLSPHEARRRRKAGDTLRALPDVAASLGVTRIRAAHVDEFTAGITKLGADVVYDAQDLLLPIAETEEPTVLREAISYLHAVLHPDDLDDKYAKGMDRADIKAAKCGDGWHLSGFLRQHVGAKLNEWLKVVSRPECDGDDRAPSARRVDGLENLLDRFNEDSEHRSQGTDAGVDGSADSADAGVADSASGEGEAGGTSGKSPRTSSARRTRPTAQLLVLADLETLLRMPGAEPATLAGFGHIGQQLLGYLTCGSDMSALLRQGVTDGPIPQAHILNVGRTSRLATRRQRQAVIARQEGTCAVPGCELSRLDIHHVQWWFRDGGRTDLSNLIGLCTRCHHLVHQNRLTIRADGYGGFVFRRSTGRAIDDHAKVNRQRLRDALAKLRHAAVANAARTTAPSEPASDRESPPREPGRRPAPRLDAQWLTPISGGGQTPAEEQLYEFIGHHIT